MRRGGGGMLTLRRICILSFAMWLLPHSELYQVYVQHEAHDHYLPIERYICSFGVFAATVAALMLCTFDPAMVL